MKKNAGRNKKKIVKQIETVRFIRRGAKCQGENKSDLMIKWFHDVPWIYAWMNDVYKKFTWWWIEQEPDSLTYYVSVTIREEENKLWHA